MLPAFLGFWPPPQSSTPAMMNLVLLMLLFSDIHRSPYLSLIFKNSYVHGESIEIVQGISPSPDWYCSSPGKASSKYHMIAHWLLRNRVMWQAASVKRACGHSLVSLNEGNKSALWKASSLLQEDWERHPLSLVPKAKEPRAKRLT